MAHGLLLLVKYMRDTVDDIFMIALEKLPDVTSLIRIPVLSEAAGG